MTQDVPVTFLEVPVVGRPVRILYNGRDDYTAPVTNVSSHPSQVNYYRVTTQAGVTCVGSYAPGGVARQHVPAVPPLPPQAAGIPPVRNTRKRNYVLVAVAVFVALGVIGAFIPDTAPDDASVEAADGSDEKKAEAWSVAQDFVRDHLKAPATAKFPDLYSGDVGVSYDGNQLYSVEGYVDAENGFSALLRTKFVCKLRDGGKAGWSLVDIQLDE